MKSVLTCVREILIVSACIVASLSDLQAAPLAAEDGSRVVREWYYSADGDYWKSANRSNADIFESFLRQGVRPIPFPFGSRNWLQDQLFFDRKGSVILNADYPVDRDIINGSLTLEVFSEEEYGLGRIEERQANLVGSEFREMRTSFIEGGALLSGTFENGEAYVITTESAIERIIRFKRARSGSTVSRNQALELLAKDLDISVTNLFTLPVSRHLDTLMLLLPGGKIILHDPKKVLPTLQQLQNDPSIMFEDRTILNLSIAHYSQARTSEAALQFMTDLIEQHLKSRFVIFREAGLFETKVHGSNDFSETTNFFNAVQGRSPRTGRQFHITNKSPLRHLHRHWVSILKRHGLADDQVFFVGTYRDSAGLNCAGSIRP